MVELGGAAAYTVELGGTVAKTVGGVVLVAGGGTEEQVVHEAALALGAAAKITTAQSALLQEPAANEAGLMPAYFGNNDMINASGRSNKTARPDLG